MSLDKLNSRLNADLNELKSSGRAKGAEMVFTRVKAAEGDNGPRYFIDGHGEQEFIKMNANSYLGLSQRADMIAAEEEGARQFGVGPGAVRFISGTHSPHIALEKKLAKFMGREAAMIFSSLPVSSDR